MRSTGVVRRVDDLGRVVIPKEMRTTLGIESGDPVEFYVDGDKVLVSKYIVGCRVCDGQSDLVNVDGVSICQGCIEDLAKNYLD